MIQRTDPRQQAVWPHSSSFSGDEASQQDNERIQHPPPPSTLAPTPVTTPTRRERSDTLVDPERTLPVFDEESSSAVVARHDDCNDAERRIDDAVRLTKTLEALANVHRILRRLRDRAAGVGDAVRE